MDRRTTPFNGRVAASELRGSVSAPRFVEGENRQVGRSVIDLCRDANCEVRDRQMLFGEHFKVLDVQNGHAFGISLRDGYVGYVGVDALVQPVDATHIVSARASHSYPAGNLKSREIGTLAFGSRLRVVGADGDFFEIHDGTFVPKVHLRPANAPFRDPASVAQLFFGAPYLWGGNSSAGIDCSGLVQAALLACGFDCPGDSDQQEDAVGHFLDDSSLTQRGDLFFWKEHVAMAVDEVTLIHANAHSMSVAYEPITDAIDRIISLDGGPVTSRRRI